MTKKQYEGDNEMMLVKEFEWKKESRMNGENIIFTAHTDAGRFTVLNRLTGWGDGCCRDTETGFKDKDGKFWLASGMFDIRRFPELTLSEAIDMVKKEANTCRGYKPCPVAKTGG